VHIPPGSVHVEQVTGASSTQVPLSQVAPGIWVVPSAHRGPPHDVPVAVKEQSPLLSQPKPHPWSSVFLQPGLQQRLPMQSPAAQSPSIVQLLPGRFLHVPPLAQV
jgi:hypothetical protein